MKTVPESLAINILSRAGKSFDEIVKCLSVGDFNGARNAIEYWQCVVSRDDAEEIRKARFTEENMARSALSELYHTTVSLRFDMLYERPARASLSVFEKNKEALLNAERILKS